MPRLVGKRSDAGANVTALLLLAAIAGVLLEYFGVIDVIPRFGREGRYMQLQGQTTNEHVAEQNQ
jgi:hypothetical protein